VNCMTNDDPKKLEEAIHRELRRLPELDAPTDLVPRVMELLAARARLPWWRRSWFTWPLPGRVLSGVAAAAVCAAAGWAIASVSVELPGRASLFDGPLAIVRVAFEAVATVLGALSLLAQAINANQLAFGAGLAAFIYLSCIGLGTACYRVAFRKTQHPTN
jgi:hypothetical protein